MPYSLNLSNKLISGVDNIPDRLLKLGHFSGNELARLASIEAVPSKTEISKFPALLDGMKVKNEKELLLYMSELLSFNQVKEAWLVGLNL